MTVDRYVLIGLGRARASWLIEVSLWANSGAMPAELSKCVSVGEVHQRLQDLRRYSAVLVEANIPSVDRDLIARAERHGVPVIVIDGSTDAVDRWTSLGAAAVLAPSFTPNELLYVLNAHAETVGSTVDTPALTSTSDDETPSGRLIAVCGPGGTGASVVAMAIAQGMAQDPLNADLVLLADLARSGEQAMLHDAGDVMPGIEDLVEANRSRIVDIDEVRALTFRVPSRNYHLLLGQRRRGSWSALPPRSIETSLVSMRRAYQYVIADITADFESENDGGSMDVEERNALSRSAVLQADLVVATGASGVKGTHSLGRLVKELLQTGVPAERVVAVVNRTPRRLSRKEMVDALAMITKAQSGDAGLREPIFLPEKDIETTLRDVATLPDGLVIPLMTTVERLLTHSSRTHDKGRRFPMSIRPGTFGLRTT